MNQQKENLNLQNRNFDLEKKECLESKNLSKDKECERLNKEQCKDLKDKECEAKAEPGFFENVKGLIADGACKAGELINTAVEKTKDFFEVGKDDLKKDEIRDLDLQEKEDIKEPVVYKESWINQDEANYHKEHAKDGHIQNENYYDKKVEGIKEPVVDKDSWINQDEADYHKEHAKNDGHIHNENYYDKKVEERNFDSKENLNKIKSTGDDQKIKEHFTEGNTNFLQPKQEEKIVEKDLPRTHFNSGFNDEFKQNLNLENKNLPSLDCEKNFERNNQNHEISVNDNSNHIISGEGVQKGSNHNKDFNNEANLNKELHQIQDSNLPLNELTSHANLVNATSAEVGQKKDENIIGLGKAQADKNLQSNQEFNQNKTITH